MRVRPEARPLAWVGIPPVTCATFDRQCVGSVADGTKDILGVCFVTSSVISTTSNLGRFLSLAVSAAVSPIAQNARFASSQRQRCLFSTPPEAVPNSGDPSGRRTDRQARQPACSPLLPQAISPLNVGSARNAADRPWPPSPSLNNWPTG